MSKLQKILLGNYWSWLIVRTIGIPFLWLYSLVIIFLRAMSFAFDEMRWDYNELWNEGLFRSLRDGSRKNYEATKTWLEK